MNVYEEVALCLLLVVFAWRIISLMERVEKLEKIVKDNDGLLAVHHFHYEEE